MIRLEVITIFLILGMFGISPSYCDDQIDEDRIKTVNGAVSAINWVKSTIGTDVIMLSTLNIFDRVIVQYYDDPNDLGALTALSIRVVK